MTTKVHSSHLIIVIDSFIKRFLTSQKVFSYFQLNFSDIFGVLVVCELKVRCHRTEILRNSEKIKTFWLIFCHVEEVHASCNKEYFSISTKKMIRLCNIFPRYQERASKSVPITQQTTMIDNESLSVTCFDCTIDAML